MDQNKNNVRQMGKFNENLSIQIAKGIFGLEFSKKTMRKDKKRVIQTVSGFIKQRYCKEGKFDIGHFVNDVEENCPQNVTKKVIKSMVSSMEHELKKGRKLDEMIESVDKITSDETRDIIRGKVAAKYVRMRVVSNFSVDDLNERALEEYYREYCTLNIKSFFNDESIDKEVKLRILKYYNGELKGEKIYNSLVQANEHRIKSIEGAKEQRERRNTKLRERDLEVKRALKFDGKGIDEQILFKDIRESFKNNKMYLSGINNLKEYIELIQNSEAMEMLDDNIKIFLDSSFRNINQKFIAIPELSNNLNLIVNDNILEVIEVEDSLFNVYSENIALFKNVWSDEVTPNELLSFVHSLPEEGQVDNAKQSGLIIKVAKSDEEYQDYLNFVDKARELSIEGFEFLSKRVEDRFESEGIYDDNLGCQKVQISGKQMAF
ncbi:MAG: hypothetical protein N4A47_01090 [Clostridia bacterium]|jgi:hypothetical protein|nr:hypothetical protein [Clostridia bacterium]